DFCDWYVEIIKPILYGDHEEQKVTVFTTGTHVLSNILKLMHPFAPFITEELWQNLMAVNPALHEETDLVVSSWPQPDTSAIDDDVEIELGLVQEVITGIRAIRSEMDVPPAREADLLIRAGNEQAVFVQSHERIIRHLARAESLTVGPELERPPHSATVVVRGMELFIPLEGLIDLAREKERLLDQIQRLGSRLQQVETKLQDREFVTKAPGDVVERERKKLGDMSDNLAKLKQNYAMLE
ncbi:MAG: class I tRNA ligase family protein, partial [Fidelibacterota bacterium]